MMKVVKKIIGISFFFVLIAFVVFQSCSKDNFSPYQVYSIDEDKCTQCRQCVPRCGYGAITYDTMRVVVDTVTWNIEVKEAWVKIDPKKCVGCGECFRACKYNAIRSRGYEK